MNSEARQSRSPSPPPAGPLPIRRLQESLINRIAAGEIIHRPASALKELIENSLDAGSTTIRVTVKDGGLKLLQIQDNGCGIRKADLPVLAQRFTTSKLTTFSDLSKLVTYGFRGEALASVSHVAHLSVVTKTKDETCACKAQYEDGELTPPKSGQTADPKPCAGNDGTTITVEDLFYNTPTRLSALRNSTEEYARILDVVTKYAVHNAHVSFTCKKAGSTNPDISTPGHPSTTVNAIKLLYGGMISRELLEVNASGTRSHSSPKKKGKRKASDMNLDEDAIHEDDEEDEVAWKAEAWISSANFHAKKMTFLLFINHRLVDSSRIKRACEGVYNGILPKGTSPFIYLSLNIDPKSVDVNVHPTKREVHFLDEEQITDQVAGKLTAALANVNSSRVFEYQTLLTGGVAQSENSQVPSKYRTKPAVSDPSSSSSIAGIDSPPDVPPQRKSSAPQHKIRSSQQDRTLDSMFPIVNPSQSQTAPVIDVDMETPPTPTTTNLKDIPESQCYLASIQSLRAKILKSKHEGLTEIFEKHVFVGIVDLYKCMSLIQHSTKLYLVNHGSLAEEFFYQLGLRQFGNFRPLKLDPPPPISRLIELAVKVDGTIGQSGLNPKDVVKRITKMLISRRDMLEEYFKVSINSRGELETLPILLRDYTPNLDRLPLFLMRLGPQVNWTSEKECFDTFLRELAHFYAPWPIGPLAEETAEEEATMSAGEKADRWQIQHVLFPSMRRYLAGTESLLDQDVVQIANLPDLYKVFERC
ncbi:DNA mismatch repair protein MutL [Sistotremastrum niveocremeum HHB9708]|uniref:DNA mismatch repair protein MutL n=1 Tax=Sistotremastrum niveocremeum HHB9708 TaxID=1314777 RepID=A0A164YND6_9AGAM|nr:DNA mismatch repair protein MutL [Sistotremastrum niveocremeum HHB9708]